METYKVEIVPVPKPRMTRADTWKKRPAVMRYWHYKDDLLHAALEQGFYLTPELELEFVLPMPKSWGKNKRANLVGQPHQQKPDVDNLAKAVMDSLLDEDSHIWSLKATKRWGETGSLIIKTGGEYDKDIGE